jgi:hypothetical protein
MCARLPRFDWFHGLLVRRSRCASTRTIPVPMVFVFQNNKVWFLSLVHRPAFQKDSASSGGRWTRFYCVTYCIVCYEMASFFYSDLACRVKVMYTIVTSLLATSTKYSVGVTALSPSPHAKLLCVCVLYTCCWTCWCLIRASNTKLVFFYIDLVENYNFDIERVFMKGHLKILKFWNSNSGNLIYISGTVKDLKLKFYQLRVLELYHYRSSFEKDMNLFAPQLFLRMVDFVDRPWKAISRDSVLNKTVPTNHLFSEMVDISSRPWKSYFQRWFF